MAGTAAAALVAGRASADNGLTVATGGATTSDEFTKVTFSGAPSGGHLFLFRSDEAAADTATPGLKGVVVGASAASTHVGVLGLHSGSSNGVHGKSVSGAGVSATSDTGPGLMGTSTSDASLRLNIGGGNADHIMFANTIGQTTPFARTSTSSKPGAVSQFSGGSIWYCVGSGTPGAWRKLAGPTTAGAYHAIATARVYDSRKTMTSMTNGIIATGANRIIDVSDKRDTGTGAVTLADVVPDRSTAVAYNLTIVSTVGTNGFLSVEPGDASAAGGSAINWSAAGLTTANASVAKLDANRQLKVFCGGTSTSCHFIVDVVGYYL